MKVWQRLSYGKWLVFSVMTLIMMILSPMHVCSQDKKTVPADVFFADFDFNDTALVHSEDFSRKMAEYVYQYHGDESFGSRDMAYIMCLKPLFEKAKVSMVLYEHILAFMLNGFENIGADGVIDYLLRFPQLEEKEISAEQGKRLESIAEPYQKVKEGAKAPDVYGLTSDGETYHLYDSKAEHILLVFWATGCDYCHELLKNIVARLSGSRDFEFVTFAIAENEADWRENLEEMKMDGFHFYDEQRWGGKAFEDYHVTQAPTVFLLDADKTIVAKVYEWRDLKKTIKKLK